MDFTEIRPYEGDVSLQNIMLSVDNGSLTPYSLLDSEPLVYLVDFSESNFNGSTFPNKTMILTVPSESDSTVSPEKSAGNSIDYRSDLYEAGVILKLLAQHAATDTGRSLRSLLFPDSAKTNLEKSIETNLFSVIGIATKNAPSERYESAAAMHMDLEFVLRQVTR